MSDFIHALHILALLIFTLMLPAILVWLLPHFTQEEGEAQRSQATYPREHSWGVTELGFEPRLSGPRGSTILHYSPDVEFLQINL